MAMTQLQKQKRFWLCWKIAAAFVAVVGADVVAYALTGCTLFDPASGPMWTRYVLGAVTLFGLIISVCAADDFGLFKEDKQ